jgi:hypothetical protein
MTSDFSPRITTVLAVKKHRTDNSNSRFQYSENQKTPEKCTGFPVGWKKMGPLLRGAYARLKPGSLFFIPWNLLAPGRAEFFK